MFDKTPYFGVYSKKSQLCDSHSSVNVARMKVEILLIFATFLEFSNSEYFSSTEELKNLNYFDEKFISWLRDFSNELDKKNALVKR